MAFYRLKYLSQLRFRHKLFKKKNKSKMLYLKKKEQDKIQVCQYVRDEKEKIGKLKMLML